MSVKGITLEHTTGSRIWNILVFGSENAEVTRLEHKFQAVLAEQGSLRVFSAKRNCDVDELIQAGYDVSFVDLDALGDGADAIVADLHLRAPGVPLIAISRSGDEAPAIAALRAGAQDCLSAAELDGPPLARAIRYAIERSCFHARMKEEVERVERDREMDYLSILTSMTPTMVSERLLGSKPLIRREPAAFAAAVRGYSNSLERALLHSAYRSCRQPTDDVHDIADRLGMLNAGPRDAVEIHKAAISQRIEGESAVRSKAYIEEGRLMLVQLMGHLVSFYRNFSWAAERVPHAPPSSDDDSAPPVSGT
ncbi:MAG: response regulator [Rhodospirillales bacterium]|nr:response regulator [Rhodospirillales bacterium]